MSAGLRPPKPSKPRQGLFPDVPQEALGSPGLAAQGIPLLVQHLLTSQPQTGTWGSWGQSPKCGGAGNPNLNMGKQGTVGANPPPPKYRLFRGATADPSRRWPATPTSTCVSRHCHVFCCSLGQKQKTQISNLSLSLTKEGDYKVLFGCPGVGGGGGEGCAVAGNVRTEGSCLLRALEKLVSPPP